MGHDVRVLQKDLLDDQPKAGKLFVGTSVMTDIQAPIE